MLRCQCSIHNGTLESLVQEKYERDIHVFVSSNCLFSFEGYLQKWLAYATEKLSEINNFSQENDVIFYIYDQIKVNRKFSSSHGESHEITLTVPFSLKMF